MQIFQGHDAETDRNIPIRHEFPHRIRARYVKIHAVDWEGLRCALRLEIYGCDGKEALLQILLIVNHFENMTLKITLKNSTTLKHL